MPVDKQAKKGAIILVERLLTLIIIKRERGVCLEPKRFTEVSLVGLMVTASRQL